MNAGIDSLVAAAISQNVPVTVINHHDGHHGFESRDNTVPTRHVIDQTIAFVKRIRVPEYLRIPER